MSEAQRGDLEARRANLRKALRAGGLTDREEALLGVVEPCVSFSVQATDDSAIPVGSSKAGGSPDVPEGFVWPTHNGTPLAFLLQLRLADFLDLPAEALPKEGLLSFFYEVEEQPWGDHPEDQGAWSVAWLPSGQDLRRVAPPGATVLSGLLELKADLSLPDPGTFAYESLSLNDEEMDAYYDALSLGHENAPRHRIGGQPHSIQNQVFDSCQDFGGAASDWRLLLQLDSDETIGVMWGDVGTLYFLILEEDLRDRRFERTRMLLQCY